MLIYPEDFQQGYNDLLAGNGGALMMDVGLIKLAKGTAFAVCEKEQETALLLLTGAAAFEWNGQVRRAGRTSLYDQMPACLHVPPGVSVTIKADEMTEVYVQKAHSEASFTPVFYAPADIGSVRMGTGGALDGCMRRNIRTVFDYENAPYSHMVLGEVLNFPGRWSSYPPHHHPQPEVYFYKFDRPQGFGAAFIGDEAFTIRHNSLALIRGGAGHPQAAAPGYAMFYVWGIRHLPGNPWIKTRTDDLAHDWLLGPKPAVWREKE